jgi:hypothetical protein
MNDVRNATASSVSVFASATFGTAVGGNHLRFCSSYCETLYDLVQRGQKTTRRWHDFLAQRGP